MTDSRFAGDLRPPYYAVIFTSLRTPDDQEAYGAMAERMSRLAAGQPGYLGIESARGSDGLGITISYWRDPASIRAWKEHVEHQGAQEKGRRGWYAHYELRVARVERAYEGPGPALHPADSGGST